MLVKLSIIFTLMLSSLIGFAVQSPQELFEAANKSYDNQQYDSSLTIYLEIEKQGLSSPELYQNMGTASYKLNLVPEAIYYFEKGLKLNPGNDDLEHNLKLAQERLTDKGGVDSYSGIRGWLSSALGGGADFWSTLSVITSILGAGFIIAKAFLSINFIKRSGFVLGITFWVFSAVFFLIAYLQYDVANSNDYGILFEPSIEVRNDPSKAASIAFVLHEGCKLQILDENEGWYKVSFDEGKVGWLPKDSIKLI